jgi:outer membrane protein
MKRPGLRIEDLVREVQDAVEEVARSVSHEQRPALYNEARGNFYFFGTTPGQMAAKAGGTLAPVPIHSAEAIEQELWGNIKDSRESSVFDEYIRQYPKGRYVGQARVMLTKLNAEAAREKSTRVAATATTPVAPSPSPAPADTGTSWKIGYIDSARVFARLGSSPQAIEKLNEQIRSLAQQSGFGIIFQEAVYVSRAIDITAPLIEALEVGASERSFGAPPPMREGVWKLGYVNAAKISERFGSRPDDLGKANQHIKSLAKKFGFGMIFQSAVYASTGIDLTDAVIRSIEGGAVNEHALRTQAPSGYRYAYVDVRRILAELPEALQARKQIEQDFKARELELQRRSGQDDDENLKHLKKTFLDDLNARKNREMGAILQKMNRVIKQVAEAERYDIIFQELVFVDPQLDITESVLRNAQR